MQTEKLKHTSKINIATQGEDVNPMVLSSQNVNEQNSRTRQAGSGMAIPSQTHRQPTPAQSSLQLQFLQAPPGQEFSFRLPDTTSQIGINTCTPTHTCFFGVASQPSSKGFGPPSSWSTSLFGGGSLGQASTAVTSHALCICSSSSTGEWHLDMQCNPLFQHVSHQPSATSVTSTYENPHSTTSHVSSVAAHEGASGPDGVPFRNSARLQRTASFYGLPFGLSRSGQCQDQVNSGTIPGMSGD